MLKPYSKAEISFVLHTNIGQEGKNSEAYIATDAQLDAEIVIKKIKKDKIHSPTAWFDEAKTLYQSSHPNVVQIHYACQDEDHIYVAMPYYANGSLKTLMKTRHLTVREIIIFGCQVASGLHNVHSKGLIHFDVKPDNVLLSDRGEAMLSDFGLTRPYDSKGLAEPSRMYTKMYPPEVWARPSYTIAFDVYQFGCTLYRLCNGDEEFYKQFKKYGQPTSFDRDLFKFDVTNGRFPDRKVFPEHIPNRLRKLILKCMSVDPADRYSTIIEAANELAKVDTHLDWKYSTTDSSKSWNVENDEYKISFTVDTDGKTKAYKTKGAGKASRIVDGCTDGMKCTAISKFLEVYHVAKD